jgi:hypothetical protein
MFQLLERLLWFQQQLSRFAARLRLVVAAKEGLHSIMGEWQPLVLRRLCGSLSKHGHRYLN